MALVEVKCPNCGANLVADNSNGKATCIYCHTEFVVESEPTGNGQELGTNTDIFENEDAALLERADTFLNKLENYNKALELYDEYSLMCPGDYRGWWGIVCALSQNFTNTACDNESKLRMEECASYAFKVSGDKREELENIWEGYIVKLSGSGEVANADTSTYKDPYRAKVLLKRIEELNALIEINNKKLETAEGNFKPMSKTAKNLCKGFSWVYGLSLAPIAVEKVKKNNIEKFRETLATLNEEKQRVISELESLK